MKKATQANLFILLATLCWGASFPIIKNTVAHLDPYAFVLLRFGLAALIVLPFLWRSLRRAKLELLMAGAILGLFSGGAYLAQTLGLQTDDASRAAFITGMNVVFVPLLLPFFGLGKPTKTTLSAALLCLYGLLVLTGTNLNHISNGDLWELLGAVLFAFNIAYLQKVTKKFNDANLLTFIQLLFTAQLALVFAKGANFHAVLDPTIMSGILFCAVFATALTIFLQTKYQQYTTATQAALIFCLEPVFATLFAYLINGKMMTEQTLIGGAIILLSTLIPTLQKYLTKTPLFKKSLAKTS